MPQATDELRKRWHHNGSWNEWPPDKQAYDYLKACGWHYHKGTWKRPSTDYRPSEDEWSALDYLIQEWDEAYDVN